MPTSDSTLVDAGFVRRLVLVNGAVPLALLAWDAYRGQLGVNGVNYAIRTTGLLGLVFLLLSLSVTPVRVLTGWSLAVAARRRLGVYAFVYVAAHFAIYVALDRAGDLTDAAREIYMRRYLQVGFLGLVLLTPLAVTSLDRAVQWMGARRWKRLHRLAYVAAVAGALHYVLLVKSDLRQPLAFAAVLAVLLGYRLVRHYAGLRSGAARPGATAPSATVKRSGFWAGKLRVARVFDETHDVRTFRLASVDGGPLPFEHRPGQYLTVAFELPGGGRARRSYTIASSPTQRAYCEITVKRVDDGRGGSRALHASLREGSEVDVSAPAGRFVFEGGDEPRVLLLAGGVGITPAMSMLRALTDRGWPGEIVLVYSVKQRRDVIFAGELTRLAERFANVRVHTTLTRDDDPSWTGGRGQISAELLRRVVPDLGAARVPVFLCGPEPMMAAMRALLAALGVRADDLHEEAFATAVAEPSGDVAPATVERSDEASGGREPSGPAGGRIRFARSKREAAIVDGQTVLEAAEGCGVEIAFECRAGVCGQCKTRLLEGSVEMDVQDALDARDRAQRIVLACQARAREAVVVDA